MQRKRVVDKQKYYLNPVSIENEVLHEPKSINADNSDFRTFRNVLRTLVFLHVILVFGLSANIEEALGQSVHIQEFLADFPSHPWLSFISIRTVEELVGGSSLYLIGAFGLLQGLFTRSYKRLAYITYLENITNKKQNIKIFQNTLFRIFGTLLAAILFWLVFIYIAPPALKVIALLEGGRFYYGLLFMMIAKYYLMILLGILIVISFSFIYFLFFYFKDYKIKKFNAYDYIEF